MRLDYFEPWNWQQFQRHFALRRLPGVEHLTADSYSRSFRLDGCTGWFRLTAASSSLTLDVSPSAKDLESQLAARVRRMFDLDSDPAAIAHHLAQDPLLHTLLRRYPGLRLPVAFDPFEQAVRTIIGQQVTVKAAVTIAGRLVERLGELLSDAPVDGPLRLFPTPQAIADDPLPGIGMPGKRVDTLRRLASAVADGTLELTTADGIETLIDRLCALPGIGRWTAEYIALRAFGEPDAFPTADLGLLKSPLWGAEGISARELQKRAELWRPWRAYAAVYLWQSYADED
ncbi:DNA-3-methyladenine glycosylase family protein [Metapseudomonas boanensis]|uniref:DNA-3-methyladenine glycosylase II n=1 Tax=Metapseudomonas boanensis TaxID=2822138 RepID=A0ABS5XML9_9GAMM|nr:DNA-3-methyladenine glycosylase [Pseudomonas boanensis]MBT8768305.1 DNA-3-methyladenine glycosylase 2 family protein [Pseudomonas boanensis]